MPRLPNPQNKDSISFKARSVFDQQKIFTFKKLAIQDGLELSDLFFEAVDLVLTKHHIENGGNPQLLLEKFSDGEPVAVSKCKCGKTATAFGLNLLSKKEFRFCSKCFSDVPQRHDPKVWRFNSDSYTAKCIGGSKE